MLTREKDERHGYVYSLDTLGSTVVSGKNQQFQTLCSLHQRDVKIEFPQPAYSGTVDITEGENTRLDPLIRDGHFSIVLCSCEIPRLSLSKYRRVLAVEMNFSVRYMFFLAPKLALSKRARFVMFSSFRAWQNEDEITSLVT